jgi:hypothetical protein
MDMNFSRLVMALFAVLSVWSAPAAFGQGTSNAFPDPISSREVDQWAAWLGLGAMDRLALDPAHEAYRESFRSLRDTRIESYLKGSNPGGGFFFGATANTDRTQIEARVKERREVLQAIERLDAEFFNRLKQTFTDADHAHIEAIDLSIRRRQARGTIGFMTLGSADTNIAELIRAVESAEGEDNLMAEMTAAQRVELHAAMLEYERALTKRLDQMADLAVLSPLRVHDAVAASGAERPQMVEGVPPDGEAFEAWIGAVEAARRIAMKESSDIRRTIIESHRAFLGRTKSLLPDAAWREVRHQFLKRSYNEAWPDPATAARLFEQAMKVESLSSEERDAVAAVRASWQSAHDAATETMLDAIDETRGEHSMFFFDDEAWRARRERMEALGESRMAVNTAAEAQLQSILGDRLTKRDQKGSGDLPPGIRLEGVELAGGEEVMIVGGDGGEMGAMVAHVINDLGAQLGAGGDRGDAFLPGPIGAKELDEYAAKLQVSPDQRAILDVLLEDYRASFTQAREEEMAGFSELGPMGELMGRDADGRPQPPDPRDIERLYAARRVAWDRLRRIDDEFMESLATMRGESADATAVESVRWARLRQVLNRERGGRGIGFGGPMSGHREASVDLAEVAKGLELSSEGDAVVRTALLSYEPQLIEALRKRRETALEAQKAIDIFHAKAMEVGEHGEVRMEIRAEGEDFQEMESARTRIEETREAVASLNRRTFDDVLKRLHETDALRFRRAYQREGFPSVYRDSSEAESTIVAAVQLEDTTPEQVKALGDLLQAHREAYEKICDDMVEASRSAPSRGPGPMRFEGGDLKAMQNLQNTLKKMRFERGELNASSRRKVKAILTPEQAARLPALSEKPKPEPAGEIFFGP